MADRHFDLNAALAEAEAEAAGDDGWLTFDLGPGYQPPYYPEDRPVDAEEGWEPAPPPAPEPWRINRLVSGWQVMKFLTAETTTSQLNAAIALLSTAFDPAQWPQFEAFLANSRVPLPVLDQLINNIVRDQIGLPLGR